MALAAHLADQQLAAHSADQQQVSTQEAFRYMIKHSSPGFYKLQYAETVGFASKTEQLQSTSSYETICLICLETVATVKCHTDKAHIFGAI